MDRSASGRLCRVGLIAAVAFAIVNLLPETATASPVEPDEIVALTHYHDGMRQQVTYLKPMTAILTSSDVPDGIWTLDERQTTVLCFQDGNNAVFFTIAGEIYAANGKARQFVDFASGDGVVLETGELRQIQELEPGLHSGLRQIVIERGLTLCGQKSLDAASEAVTAGAENSDMSVHQAAMLTTALAVRGAELCRFQLDEVAVVDYLQANQIDFGTFNSEISAYGLVVMKMFSDVGEQEFCHTILLPKFGPEGRKFVTR